MLVAFEVSTRQGDTLTLPLDDVSSGVIVQNISGLAPVKATLVSSSFAGVDGEQYQSSRRETRNITIKLGLDPDPLTSSVSELRQQLQGFFMPKSEIDLTFYRNDTVDVSIAGVVESFDSELFSQDS
jgi:hypothetical protein